MVQMHGERAYLASLVLRDLVLSVLLAVLALAVGAAGLGNVDLIVGPSSAIVHFPNNAT